MKMKYAEYCSPQPDGHSYSGWHISPLKCLDEATANRLAMVYHKTAFYCEYGGCWHLGR